MPVNDMFSMLDKVTSEAKNTSILPTGYENYYNILAVVVNIMIGVTLFFGVLGIIIAAISAGLEGTKPEAMNKFKSTLTYSIVALILAFSLVTLKVVILNTIGATDSPYMQDLPDY